MPVRSPDGLIGRIIDAGAIASRVLLVSDRSNIVPARLLRSGIPVIAQGRGDGTIDVRPLEVGRNPFKRGDIIVTSGTGGLYPPSVPIARVVKLVHANTRPAPRNSNRKKSKIRLVRSWFI